MSLDCHVKNGRKIVMYEEWSGHLSMSATEQTHALVLNIRGVTTDELGNQLHFSHGSACEVIYHRLHVCKVCWWRIAEQIIEQYKHNWICVPAFPTSITWKTKPFWIAVSLVMKCGSSATCQTVNVRVWNGNRLFSLEGWCDIQMGPEWLGCLGQVCVVWDWGGDYPSHAVYMPQCSRHKYMQF
jgi:hypothetical protein